MAAFLPDVRSTRYGRRGWLQLAGSLGLQCAIWQHAPPAAAQSSGDGPPTPGFGRARRVIVIFASGGQSQIDTWDPKPQAPREIRGAFDSISTSIPGIQFCEHMPRLAQIAKHLCIVRNMSHEDLDHGSAFYLSMTGRYHRRRSSNPLPTADDAPCCGAILQRIRPATEFVQTAVHLNGPAEVPLIVGPGQFGGLLGRSFDPLTLGNVTQDREAIPSLRPHDDVPFARLEGRRSLLESVEQSATQGLAEQSAIDKQSLYRQAFELLNRPATRAAFDLSREPRSLRERYGQNRSGMACLLARRLAEAGVPLVTVFWSHNNRGQDADPSNTDLYGWDTHNDIFSGLQHHLLPRFDQGFSALIEDLSDHGMLEDTLVVCLGEFGRAPLVALEPNFAGSSPGRKHWSWVYSIALAGAGVRGGTVVGESDSRGAYPRSDPWGPWDVTATIFSALGIDPHQTYRDPLNRPLQISDGRVMTPIYG